MIAKRVHRARGGSFKRLAGYIAKAEAVKWQRTADYILDTLGKGARATGVHITNCQAEELEEMLAEITATQKRNRRARGERTYHLVISFPEDERPEPDQLHDIEDELCAAIGLGSHQRLSAVQTDTAHLHIHVAINQVHPQTLALIEPWYDKVKLMAACERLEIKHGLQQTSHRSGKQRSGGRAADMEAQSGELSFTGSLKQIEAVCMSDNPDKLGQIGFAEPVGHGAGIMQARCFKNACFQSKRAREFRGVGDSVIGDA
jgi:hypothetical protein